MEINSFSINFSFILIDGKYELSPFCDLISYAIYPTLDAQFSFKIGGVSIFSSIGFKGITSKEKELWEYVAVHSKKKGIDTILVGGAIYPIRKKENNAANNFFIRYSLSFKPVVR